MTNVAQHSDDDLKQPRASQQWIRKQTYSLLHFVICAALAALGAYGTTNPLIFWWGVGGFLGVSILYMIVKSPWIFLALVALTIFGLVIPALHGVVALIALVLTYMRIRTVIRHWRPLLLGLVVYGSLLLAYYLSLHYITHTNPLRHVAFTLIVLVLHLCFRWLYSWSYSPITALALMGIVPLFILAFLLPLLKLKTHIEVKTYVDAHPAPPPPGFQHIDSYTRVMDGHTQLVHEHIRTTPDGILENNLSYNAKPEIHSIAEVKPDIPPEVAQAAEVVSLGATQTREDTKRIKKGIWSFLGRRKNQP